MDSNLNKNPSLNLSVLESILFQNYYNLKILNHKFLESYTDQNLYILASDGNEYVLKVSHELEKLECLEFQNKLMLYLKQNTSSIECPYPVKTLIGEFITRFEKHFVRLIKYIPGILYGNMKNHASDKLAFRIGRSIASMDKTLFDFPEIPPERTFLWDLKDFLSLKSFTKFLKENEKLEMINKVISLYEENHEKIKQLRQTVIHNDASDFNTLINPTSESVIGFIDFGDSVKTYLLAELAITLVYTMFNQPDPLKTAYYIIMGYNSSLPLDELECELLYYLIIARLATSILISNASSQNNPNNDYILISQKPALLLLKLFLETNPDYFKFLVRQACHFKNINQKTPKLISLLNKYKESFHPVLNLDFNQKENFILLDFSSTSPIWCEVKNPGDPVELSAHLFSKLNSAKAKVGVGKYLEDRNIYQSDNYIEQSDKRTIHLGIDLFTQAETSVYVPLDGVVHSFANRDIALDYGPVIILKHSLENIEFYTLYGHLSQSSLTNLYTGKIFEKGSILGYIGNYPSNGNWPPHLHFQMITEMLGYSGDYPGVCSKSRKKLWSSMSPDPNLILNIENSTFSESSLSKSEILLLRETYLASSLSLSYKEHLLITRGSGQYLYTDRGEEYLDGINNVALVGHSHPRLSKIFSEQSKLINTNTRYLSPDLVLYSKSLLEKFPKPLNKCFIVNSGSEANDLALRLAFAYTKKTDIVVMDQGYHGHLTSLIPLSTYKLKKVGLTPPPYVHVAPLPSSSDPLKQIKYFFENFPCAAFLCESAPSCAGQVFLEEHLLFEIANLAKQNNVVMIMDEVQTGMGRFGTWWGFEKEKENNSFIVIKEGEKEWNPDIVTLGKGLGGGMALGAVVARKEIVEAFEKIGMEYFNTFGGGNLACKVGLEVLKIIEEEKVIENAAFLGKVLLEDLNRLKKKWELIWDVRGRGLFIGIELMNENKEPAGKEAKWLVEYMKEEEKILLSTDGPNNNVIKFKPPMCWNIDNCLDLVRGIERGMEILNYKKI